eukprot:s3760_g5.t1
MDTSLAEGAQRVEPAVPPEASAAPDEDQGSEDRRHLQEVRLQEVTLEPDYAEKSAEQVEGHGSHGSQAGSLLPREGVEPAAGGQPSHADFADAAPRDEQAAGPRSMSAERRSEDVSQVQRSLNFMTGLLTMEQWQSATGSTAGGGVGSVGESSAMTPVTPHPGTLGWADVDRLNQQLANLGMGEERSRPDLEIMTPLASTARIMEGTFSSDSSETARKRAEEAQRGVPGALLGPLALADRPFYLEGDPMAVDQTGDAGPSGNGWPTDGDFDNTYFSEYAAASKDYGVFEYARALAGNGIFKYRAVFEEHGVFEYVAGVGLGRQRSWWTSSGFAGECSRSLVGMGEKAGRRSSSTWWRSGPVCGS